MITKDRNYYRQFGHNELLDTVKLGVNVNWQELAIVLAERLEDEVKDKDEAAPDPAYDGD